MVVKFLDQGFYNNTLWGTQNNTYFLKLYFLIFRYWIYVYDSIPLFNYTFHISNFNVIKKTLFTNSYFFDCAHPDRLVRIDLIDRELLKKRYKP